jgi:nitrile hydratase
MDGIHDVGGMDGFGDLPPDEPDDASPFHEGWEGRVQAAYIAGLGNDVFNLDQFRHTLERHEPTYYLETPYYERWLTGVSDLFVEAGVIDEAELKARTEAFEAGEAELSDDGGGPSLSDLVPGVAEHYISERPDREKDPQFEDGDRVRVRKNHPSGHTRCPRYVRGATGEVVAHRGTHVYPDAHAHGEDAVEPLYNVKFDAADLWGEEHTDADTVRIELWERYIEADDE